jgi:lysyl-tRNA synthetase class 2
VFRTRPPASASSLLATAAALAGVIGVASALTPELADRFDLVRGVLPPGVPETARVLALAFGLGLIWLSRSLARRKRRAWQLAIALVAASAVAHLAKGLDFEEALFSVAVLVALWRYRRQFDAAGDPTSVRPLLQAVLALSGVGLLAYLRVWASTGNLGDVVDDSLAVIAGALAVRALYLWLRPIAGRARQTPAERAHAERVVEESGHDSLCYFALRRDKSYFFSPSGRSFLAYRVVSGTALVSGDPIGETAELDDLLAEFRRVAQARAWRVAVVGASEELLPLYRRAGLRPVYLGDEAVVDPAAFSLDGRAIRKVRQSVNRLERAGYRVSVVQASAADRDLRDELQSVSAEWRGRWPERGFAMAMDGLFDHGESRLIVAEASDGSVGGFIQLVPSPASGAWSLATMRRRPGTPNGLMEFLLVKTVEWAREEGVPELSLNFAVFAEILRAGAGAPIHRRLLRKVLLRLDRFFQLDRLLSFSDKFFPTWRPRYICVERLSDFPLVGFAFLHAESLLTLPGPWARSSAPANQFMESASER